MSSVVAAIVVLATAAFEDDPIARDLELRVNLPRLWAAQ
jgi:hypothetical protein